MLDAAAKRRGRTGLRDGPQGKGVRRIESSLAAYEEDAFPVLLQSARLCAVCAFRRATELRPELEKRTEAPAAAASV